jgi:phosphate transport system protein
MRHHFSEQLDVVLDDLAELAVSVQIAARRATEALVNADGPVAEEVISGDADIDACRDRVEEKCFRILSLQQPVAGDLRTVVAALRMGTELERAGDLATHVAKVARMRVPGRAVPDDLAPVVARMAEIAVEMMGRCAAIIAERDIAGLVDLGTLDDEMDQLRAATLASLVEGGGRHAVEAVIDLALISRYYERIGDHAVSVAKRVGYVITGERP